MKHQAPTYKLQRSSKLQSRAEPIRELSGWELSEPDPVTWLLGEDPPAPDNRHPFDLEERTARFGEAIVRFAKKIPRGPMNDRLIDQLVGCGTSVGANYCEANEGVSKKDFRFIIGRCVKEAKETKYFLRMVATAVPDLAGEARTLFREAKELHLIFASIFRKTG